MKPLIIAIALLIVYIQASSQDARYIDFYNYDPKLINPAFAGLVNEQSYHVQYSGSTEDLHHPYIGLTAFSTQLSKINSGIGAMLWRSVSGPYSENNTSIMYNYHLKFGDTKCLSIGTQVGYSQRYIDGSHYRYIQSGDALIVEDKEKYSTNLIGDFGIVYKVKTFNAGFSSVNLLQSEKDEYRKVPRSYSVFVQDEFKITSWLTLKPSILYRTQFTSAYYIDLNGAFVIKDMFLFGTTTQISKNLTSQKFMAGIDIKKRLQLIGTVYPYVYRNTSEGYTEVMVKLRIENKRKS